MWEISENTEKEIRLNIANRELWYKILALFSGECFSSITVISWICFSFPNCSLTPHSEIRIQRIEGEWFHVCPKHLLISFPKWAKNRNVFVGCLVAPRFLSYSLWWCGVYECACGRITKCPVRGGGLWVFWVFWSVGGYFHLVPTSNDPFSIWEGGQKWSFHKMGGGRIAEFNIWHSTFFARGTTCPTLNSPPCGQCNSIVNFGFHETTNLPQIWLKLAKILSKWLIFERLHYFGIA